MTVASGSGRARLGYRQRQRPAKNHLPGIAFVILLHIVIIWALVSGLARKTVELIAKPLETQVIAELAKPPQDAPPPPPPKMAPPPPPPFIPPPELNIQAPPTISTAAITVVTSTPPVKEAPRPEAPPPPPPVAAPKAPVRVPPVVQAASCQQPSYPAASRRAGETGAVTLDFLIDAEGKVIESRIASSSGFERLDEAARRALSLCKFTPGSVDGKSEQSWHKLRYVWQLDR